MSYHQIHLNAGCRGPSRLAVLEAEPKVKPVFQNEAVVWTRDCQVILPPHVTWSSSIVSTNQLRAIGYQKVNLLYLFPANFAFSRSPVQRYGFMVYLWNFTIESLSFRHWHLQTPVKIRNPWLWDRLFSQAKVGHKLPPTCRLSQAALKRLECLVDSSFTWFLQSNLKILFLNIVIYIFTIVNYYNYLILRSGTLQTSGLSALYCIDILIRTWIVLLIFISKSNTLNFLILVDYLCYDNH